MTLSTNSITPLSESPGDARRDRFESTNNLVDFESENAESTRSEARILPFSERTPVSLATLKRDRIQFDAAEAISLGQALCLALMTAQRLRRINTEGDLASPVAPVTTDTVFIDPTSRLGVSVSDPGDELTAIQAVGRILSDIMPRDTRASRETKIISKALASPPQFATMSELSEALAAFEQSEGRELIQAVYERWKKGDVTARALPSLDSRPTSPIRLGSQPLGVAVAVIVVAILIVGVSAGFLMRRSPAQGSTSTNAEGGTSTVETAPLLDARAIAPVTSGLPPWSVARADRPAISASSVVHAKPPAPTAPSPAAARIQRPASALPSPSIARVELPVVSDLPIVRPIGDPPSIAPQLAERVERDATPVSGDSDVIRNSNNVVSATTGRGDSARASSHSFSHIRPRPVVYPRTYGPGDVDVAPPIPVLPRLLAGLQPSSPGVRLDALQLAVVVEPDGTAFSVTAMSAPQNMAEFVLITSVLAVVKSWEFTPAKKDGVPVRYQLIVPVRSVTKSAP